MEHRSCRESRIVNVTTRPPLGIQLVPGIEGIESSFPPWFGEIALLESSGVVVAFCVTDKMVDFARLSPVVSRWTS